MNMVRIAYIQSVRRLVHQYLDCSKEVSALIACQSALETAFGTSDIYLENHNLFGMKYPRYRITRSLSSNRGHALYSCAADSVIDLVYWLIFNNFDRRDLSSVEAFVMHFKHTAFNPNMETYVKSIMQIYDGFKAACHEDLSL